jgi:hypothetical protein
MSGKTKQNPGYQYFKIPKPPEWLSVSAGSQPHAINKIKDHCLKRINK